MNTYGLIGQHLEHSFSPAYFATKFEAEGIEDAVYRLFPLETIDMVDDLFGTMPHLKGLNVTIPYKRAIVPFLDGLSPQAEAIGAVNTIEFVDGRKIGHNTDVYGFQMSLEACLTEQQRLSKALVLGTGGASKAVCFALDELGIAWQYVSRRAGEGVLTYAEISPKVLANHLIVVQTTPLGMYPKVDTCPTLPYAALGGEHLLFDLVYNPRETLFLKKGAKVGAMTKNGLEMLHLQAEGAWAIWNAGRL